tara:strand:- start:1373 stop:2065 length:693 start_codon:yes stop_codon:yes gene_type:complete
MVTNIAIIGHGIVGKATEEVLLKKNNIQIHDPEKGHKCDYKNADVVFICTPYEHVGRYMIELKHNQNVFVRSTIPLEWVINTDFAVWPEFLTERTWKEDANKPLCLVCGGTEDNVDLLKKITKFKDNWFLTENHIAALMKNSTNVFYTMKVSYANILYDLCGEYGIPYQELQECIKQDPRMGDEHWQVPGPDGKRGYGGKCFPQNLQIMQDQTDKNDLLIEVERYNNNIR